MREPAGQEQHDQMLGFGLVMRLARRQQATAAALDGPCEECVTSQPRRRGRRGRVAEESHAGQYRPSWRGNFS